MDTTITVYERAGQAGVPWPISVVVPLPRGAETGVTPPLCLYGPDGAAVPCQLDVLSRWWGDTDQSVRLLEVTFIAEGLRALGSKAYTLRRGNPRRPAVPANYVSAADFETELNGARVWGASSVLPAASLNRAVRYRDADIIHAGAIPGLITVATAWAGIPWMQLDLLLMNNRFDRRAGSKFRVNTWTMRGHLVVYQGKYSPVRKAADGQGGVDLLWDYDLHDMAAFRRRVLVADGVPESRVRLSFLEPPVAVVDAATYERSGQGAWPFKVFPAARDAKPVLQPPAPKDFLLGHKFWRLEDEKARWYDSNKVGLWAYPDDAFIATGSPADAEVDWDLAVGETTLLPQAVYGYEHSMFPAIGLDEAPYGGGSWRYFYQKKAADSLSARDSQHGWHYHVAGAWRWSADPLLGEWLKGAGQMRIAELTNQTLYPSTSARALGHSLALAVQSYEVDGNPDVLQACRARLHSLSNGWYKAADRKYALGYGSFKDGYLCRAVLALMANLGPDDPDYWRGLQWIARTVAWNVRYGNFPNQVSTSKVVNAVEKSKIESLTLADIQAWWAWEYSDRKAWIHVKKYVAGELGRQPAGVWGKWTGQYEARYWLARAAHQDDRQWAGLAAPDLRVDATPDGVQVQATLPEGTREYCLVYARRPLKRELDPAADVQNWWSAPVLRAGAGGGEVSAMLEPRSDGGPWYFAIQAWGDNGRSWAATS